MSLQKQIFGYEKDKIPNIPFRVMSLSITLRDILFPVRNKLNGFDIKKGFVVIDFGCGPGSYVEKASQLVGDGGKVYAVDVHVLAIRSINKKVIKKSLSNVVPVLSTGYPVDIDSHSADVIYALDMFHHVKDARAFLEELNRLLKPSGALFIESGHQPLNKAKEKIVNSGSWEIINEEKGTYKCIPVDNSMDA